MEVLQSADPQQVLVLVRAALPNTCLRLGEAVVEQQGREFIVNLPGVVDPSLAGDPPGVGDQACQAVKLNQDQVVRLTNEALAPGSYIVLVNGVLGTFRVNALGQTAPVSVVQEPAEAVIPASGGGAAAAPTLTPADSGNASAEPTSATPTAAPTATAAPEEALFPEPTPTIPPLALASGTDPANCANRAALYGTLTIPDGTPFLPETKFKKTWLVMNTGSCTWGPAYQLVFAGGDPLGAQQKIPMPYARPRQVVQVTAEMTAPVAPRSYESRWAIESPQGYVFGLGNPATTALTAKISVVTPPVGLPSALNCGALRQEDMEQQVLAEINDTRAQYGLPALALVADISRVALKHSLEMACFDRTSHHGVDGMLYTVRLQRDGVLYSTSSEIIYAGDGGPAGALDWWMHSALHKSIILSDKYTQVGVGYVFYDGNAYQQRITVNFIKP